MISDQMEHTRHTVLIVDDDEDVRFALQGLLEEDDHEVYAVENGLEALNIVKMIRPCIILTDMRMPTMNGFTLCKKLKEDPLTQRIPVVLVTAMVRDEDVEMGLKSGAVDYIKKPFDRYETRMRVMSQIRLHETLLRKEAVERQLGIISRAAKDAIVVIDNDGRVTHWNEAAEQMFGFRKSEILGEDLHALVAPREYHGQLGEAFPKFQKDGQGAAVGKTVELSALRKGGEQFAVELSLSATTIDGMWHAVGIIRNITERKKLEHRLLKAQKLETLGQLAAGIAHEVNTPTQFIGDNATYLSEVLKKLSDMFARFTELTAELKRDPRYDDMLSSIEKAIEHYDVQFSLEDSPRAIENIRDGVHRITRIIRAMKEFSHPGTQKKRHADLNHLLENTITMCFNEYKYVSELTMNLDSELPMVLCYPVALSQVFLNLIVNAAHAISEAVGDSGRKGLISITSSMGEGEVCITISDTGKGIPADIGDRIYEPFFTTKDLGKGSGQGLSIARSIVVDKHQGSLSHETSEGRGTTFVVRLPHEY